jgi:hypothetical protein
MTGPSANAGSQNPASLSSRIVICAPSRCPASSSRRSSPVAAGQAHIGRDGVGVQAGGWPCPGASSPCRRPP